MSWFMVDIESDGAAPGLYSMLSVGCIMVVEPLEEAPTFYGEMHPLVGAKYMPAALKVCGFDHEQTKTFTDPAVVMNNFHQWVLKNNGAGRPQFISDNNGFDWQFVNYYFWRFCEGNPFGHSSQNIGSLYKGMKKDMFQSFKHLRDTKHSHNALMDARGNAEAMIKLKHQFGFKFKLK